MTPFLYLFVLALYGFIAGYSLTCIWDSVKLLKRDPFHSRVYRCLYLLIGLIALGFLWILADMSIVIQRP